MKLKSILYLLLTLPFLWSCNDEDNVDDIFVSGQWVLLNYYTQADWSSNNDYSARPEYDPAIRPSDGNILQVIQKFTITFKNDGTFDASAQGSNFSGKWSANGKERTVMITINNTPSNASNYVKRFIDTLKNARFYKGSGGNAGYLQLAPENKLTFIQLRHL